VGLHQNVENEDVSCVLGTVNVIHFIVTPSKRFIAADVLVFHFCF